MTGRQRYSDYIVYVDEAGDHGPATPEFPVFVLAFCLFQKLEYADVVARPIGLTVVRPGQPNRAFDLLSAKLRRSQAGVLTAWAIQRLP